MGVLTRGLNQIRKFVTGSKSFGSGYSVWNNWWGGLTNYGRRAILDQYKELAFNCINVRAQEVGKYTPLIYQENYKKVADAQPIEHPLENVLERPNPILGAFQLWELKQKYQDLTGECFFFVERDNIMGWPLEFWPIAPHKVDVALDEKTGRVIGYTVHRDDGQIIPLDFLDMIHFKETNPKNIYRGIGITEANGLSIDTDQITSLFQFNFMRNQASPSGVLTLKGTISEDAFKQIKKEWAEQQTGVKNSGKTLMLREAEADFKKIGLSLSDLDMTALKDLTEKRVLNAYRVPKPLLGETEVSGLGRNNIDSIKYLFAENVIDVEYIKADETLELYARQVYDDPTLYIGHKNLIPQDRQADLEEDKALVDVIKTRDEIRLKRGLDARGGLADTLYYNFNQVPFDDDLIRLPTAQETDTSNTDDADEDDNANADDDPKNDDDNQDNLEPNTKKKHLITPKPFLNKMTQTAFRDQLARIETYTAERYSETFETLLEQQESKVIADFRQIAKIYDDAMPDAEAEARYFAAILFPILLNAINSAGELGIAFTGANGEFMLTPELRAAIYEATQKLMGETVSRLINELQETLLKGVAEGETALQLTDRIKSVYKSNLEDWKLERLARTEAHRASNAAMADAFRQAGYTKMQWRARPGACQYCAQMNGTIVNIGESFVPQGGIIYGTDGGEYLNSYQDIKYADAHPNCGCLLIPVSEVG